MKTVRRATCFRRGLGVVFLVALLAGCQPLPRPFAHDGTAGNALLDLAGSGGIVVRPVVGAPAAARGRFAAALAAALRDAGLPAVTEGGNGASLILEGRAVGPTIVGEAAARGELMLFWFLKGPDGGEIGRHEQRETVPAAAWRRGDPALISFISGKAAERLARIVRGGESLAVAPRPELKLVVWPVDGAPGDGGRSLTSAVKSVLRRSQVALRPVASDDTFVLLGSVYRKPAAGGRERVSIRWTLIRPDGREIGSVDQANTVPTGQLDGPWGAIALAIAESATPAILSLVEAARKDGRAAP
ncbi:MAG: hypothetical protein ACTSXZ_02210 [Alphaproteobacteria bacterium]